jgi:hypothetical protein
MFVFKNRESARVFAHALRYCEHLTRGSEEGALGSFAWLWGGEQLLNLAVCDGQSAFMASVRAELYPAGWKLSKASGATPRPRTEPFPPFFPQNGEGFLVITKKMLENWCIELAKAQSADGDCLSFFQGRFSTNAFACAAAKDVQEEFARFRSAPLAQGARRIRSELLPSRGDPQDDPKFELKESRADGAGSFELYEGDGGVQLRLAQRHEKKAAALHDYAVKFTEVRQLILVSAPAPDHGCGFDPDVELPMEVCDVAVPLYAEDEVLRRCLPFGCARVLSFALPREYPWSTASACFLQYALKRGKTDAYCDLFMSPRELEVAAEGFCSQNAMEFWKQVSYVPERRLQACAAAVWNYAEEKASGSGTLPGFFELNLAWAGHAFGFAYALSGKSAFRRIVAVSSPVRVRGVWLEGAHYTAKSRQGGSSNPEFYFDFSKIPEGKRPEPNRGIFDRHKLDLSSHRIGARAMLFAQADEARQSGAEFLGQLPGGFSEPDMVIIDLPEEPAESLRLAASLSSQEELCVVRLCRALLPLKTREYESLSEPGRKLETPLNLCADALLSCNGAPEGRLQGKRRIPALRVLLADAGGERPSPEDPAALFAVANGSFVRSRELLRRIKSLLGSFLPHDLPHLWIADDPERVTALAALLKESLAESGDELWIPANADKNAGEEITQAEHALLSGKIVISTPFTQALYVYGMNAAVIAGCKVPLPARINALTLLSAEPEGFYEQPGEGTETDLDCAALCDLCPDHGLAALCAAASGFEKGLKREGELPKMPGHRQLASLLRRCTEYLAVASCRQGEMPRLYDARALYAAVLQAQQRRPELFADPSAL